jgi:hypothetical protein
MGQSRYRARRGDLPKAASVRARQGTNGPRNSGARGRSPLDSGIIQRAVVVAVGTHLMHVDVAEPNPPAGTSFVLKAVVTPLKRPPPVAPVGTMSLCLNRAINLSD